MLKPAKMNAWLRACGAITVCSLLIAPVTSAAQVRVALIGHDARVEALPEYALTRDGEIEIADGDILFYVDEDVYWTVERDASIDDFARILNRSTHALIFVDVGKGFDDTIQDHILIARQLLVSQYSIFIANTSALDGKETAEQQLNAAYRETQSFIRGLAATENTVHTFQASLIKGGVHQTAHGFDLMEALDSVREIGGVKYPIYEYYEKFEGTRLQGQLFLLKGPAGAYVEVLNDGDEVLVWIAGKTYNGIIETETPLLAGEDKVVDIRLDGTVKTRFPKSYFIHDGKRVYAGGVADNVYAE